MNLRELVNKATDGTLSSGELEAVVACLTAGTCDPYKALLVIGRAGASQYRELVDGYLSRSDDPMLVRLALMVLCRYWGLAAEYKPALEMFARKVEWDDEDDVRILAISIIGTLLASQPDDTLLKVLIEIFRDETEMKPQILRETAYLALGEASGKSPLELPPASRHFDLENGLDPAVVAYIEAAERRLAQ